MELRQLSYFVAVCEELSFSRAAARCFISQSAISHQIARLEHDLGVQLFERSTRSVVPTEATTRLLPLAKQMLSLESAIRAAVRASGPRIRLAANMSFATRSLSAIAGARESHPGAEIEFVIKPFRQRIAAVADGDCDLALIRGSVDQPGLSVEQLWVEDLVIAASTAHPLAGRTDVTLAELGNFPLLLPPEQEQVLLHNVVRAAFADLPTRPTYGPPIPPDHTATMELINRPDAWTILYADSATEGIATLHLGGRPLRVQVSAVLRSDARRSPILETLLAALHNS
ncbi:LysR family transcriptional regulator [Nocardia terpenica]|uniref:LysR family transcriptional regulator n=1 Tax=Nocardia terpenica TaxID=455432 RepID=A0A291RXE5_9NOCA|nr:LysR family transcriptional regulator [Nocardia terpenica]ATL72183.1 LysR family transcriptional regulator [Nocardia terpenica]MBF6063936.1 LysR family transcriptional regulator [Nocardia terpenica]MBF6107828.1 LysR family transcriptional regulator [Nocardia terpenica]MBF6114896.1 LysR family transcriptional regulator [Nocardia terpenica]MBF6121117.1 LysR family transcriptional regulator [Nocardia terpenica]